MKSKFFALLLAFCLLASNGLLAFAAIDDTGFSDIAPDAWYTEAVTYCRDNGIMSGTTETEFAPNATMNRAMLATVLWRMAGSEPTTGVITFADIQMGSWYTDAVRWAVQSGIISGYSNTTFGTNDPVTREQIATMLYRYEQYQNGVSDASGTLAFSDSDNISVWAVDAVAWAAEQGIVSGRAGNLFDPQAVATRAEVAVILHRYLLIDKQMPEESPSNEVPEPESIPNEPEKSVVVDEDGMIAVNIAVGDRVFVAKFYDNTSARTIIEQMPFSLDMDDYAQQEKVQGLPFSLPNANIEKPATIHTGDIYLWSSNQLVLFYTTFSNSYSYIPVGYIEDTTGLTTALGSRSVTVTFSIP